MPTVYHHIIVAIDFSEQAKKAYQRAVEIANSTNATLHLVSVVDTYSNASVETFDRKYAVKIHDEYAQKLEIYKQKAIESGVTHVLTHVEFGSPKQILTNFEKAELIVIGATGLNAAQRFILGSVSSNVVRHAKCDVLVVK
ncbi:universal stress protein [Solibacillus sp. FSL H8-0538]|uniref:universal stress protein n=1 Tax=Solibacillus sp. FSL H8-0538 TaxID=2921400 RepID=UPI0030FBA24C